MHRSGNESEALLAVRLLSAARPPSPPATISGLLRDGKVMADSREVARVFEKRHDNVLNAIKSLN